MSSFEHVQMIKNVFCKWHIDNIIRNNFNKISKKIWCI